MLFGDLISPALSTAALPVEVFHSKKPMGQELHPQKSAVCLGQRTTSSIPLKKLNLKPNKSPDSIYHQLQSLQSNSAVLVHGPVQWRNDGSLATSDSIESFGQGSLRYHTQSICTHIHCLILLGELFLSYILTHPLRPNPTTILYYTTNIKISMS